MSGTITPDATLLGQFPDGGPPGGIVPVRYRNIVASKRSVVPASRTVTGATTLAVADVGQVIIVNSAAACNVTIPNNATVAIPLGAQIEVLQIGVGLVTMVPQDGTVSFITPPPSPSLTQAIGQGAHLYLYQYAANQWSLTGDLQASNFFASPGSLSSLFHSPLTVANTYTTASTLSTRTIALSGWQVGPSASFATYLAKTTDPIVSIMTGAPGSGGGVAMFTGVVYNGGTWQRFGNGSSVDATIKGMCTTTQPSTDLLRFYYVTSTAGGTHTVPAATLYPPAAGPYTCYCPAGATPTLDSDGFMLIFQPNGTVVEIETAIVLGDGTICCGVVNITDPTSLLDWHQGGIRAGLTPAYAGLITGAEITALSIPHALAMNLPPSELSSGVPLLPCATFDNNQADYAGTHPYGTRFGIPWTFNPNTFGWNTTVGKTIGIACQNYGIFHLDQGGGGITINTRPDVDALAPYGLGLQTDLNTILGQLKVVT